MSEAADRLRAASAEYVQAGPGLRLPIDGLEHVVAGVLGALPETAWWVPGPREAVGAVLRDVPPERLADPNRGAKPYKVAPVSHAPATRALQAVGLALASGGPVAVHLGMAALGDGAFVEALNVAALKRAPVVFVLAQRELGDDAPIGPQSAALATAIGETYGVLVASVSGADEAAVGQAIHDAVAAGGPALVLANL